MLEDDRDDDDEMQDEPMDEVGGAGAGAASAQPYAITRDPRDPDRRFCPQCGNMWYPREDRAQQKLMLSCRNCNYEELAEKNKIYENKLKKEVRWEPSSCLRSVPL